MGPEELVAAIFRFYLPRRRLDPEEYLFRRVDEGKYILFCSCDNRQNPCSRVDGFRDMPAARDSANSSGYGGAASGYGGGYGGAASGYGGAAEKGLTMVKITNLPEQITSKHKLYELFKTFGSVTNVDILRPGGIGFVNFIRREDAERAINQLDGWCWTRLTLVKPGPEQGIQYGQKTVKPGPEQGMQYGQKTVKPEQRVPFWPKLTGDARGSGQSWTRDTVRPFWQKPVEDTLVRGRDTSKSGDHKFQSNRKWTDRSQFGYGRPYWKP